MRITDNIYINLNNPTEEFTLGIHNEKTLASWTPIDKEPEDDDFQEMNRLIIGFLIFNITILY